MSDNPQTANSCASFFSPDTHKLDSREGKCTTCGFPASDHVTVEQLEAACQKREARLVVNKPRFRRYIQNGFRFDCVPIYVRDVAPFGLSGWAMYLRGWRIVRKEVDTWQPERRAA